jgi:hypothetical protein
MFDKEKLIKIKSIYIYVISILVFSSSGFFYGNTKFDFSEFESILVLGNIGGRNILPPQAISEIVSKPSLLKGDALSLCYGISGNVGIPKSQVTYQIVSESVGFLRLRASDLNWLRNLGEECVFKIIESINAQEFTYVENGRFAVSEGVNYKFRQDKILTLNLTKIIGTPLLKEKPDLGNRNKYFFLGTFFGLLVAYGLSNLLKRS